jgi:hypothetical protein
VSARVTFDPAIPRVPDDLPLNVQYWLRWQLRRVRIAVVKEDHRGLYAILDRIADQGFPEIRRAVIDTLKNKLLREIVHDQLRVPYAWELHTLN